jgi:hypothetical protein
VIRITVAGAAAYPIDCALSERLRLEADITENAVESGSAISDNIRPKLPVLEFEGVVSDTPLGLVALDPSRTVLDGKSKPSRDAFDRFVAIHEGREPVIVECSYGKFEDMALESLSTDKDPKSAKAFKFTATFRKIKIVTNNRTTVRMRLSTSGPGGARTSPVAAVNLGHRESEIWGEKLGLKGVIWVISQPTDARVRNVLIPKFGAPLMTRRGDPSRGEGLAEYDCYEVHNTQVPDGYLTENSSFTDPTVGHASGGSPYTYTPMGIVPTSYYTREEADEQPRYDSQSKQWLDKNGNPVTKTPPPPENWRNILWGKD